MSSSSPSQEPQRLSFTFTFSEEERDWLLIALENEIFKRKQWSAPYSQSRVFEQDTSRLLRLYERMQRVSLEEMRLNGWDDNSK